VPVKSKSAIVKQFKQHLQETQRGLGSQYSNTRRTQAFYAGDMMAYRDTMQFSDPYGQKKKAIVQFNKVKPYVNAVKGFMAQNRREAKYVAHMDNNPVQEFYSKYANAMKGYIREQANADQKETQMNGDMLINGYGAMETDMTYGIGASTTDPNGQIVMGRLDPLQVGWDPYAREPNLMDARWCFYQRDYALEDAMELFSDDDPDDFENSTDHDLGEDSNYQWYTAGGRYNKIREANIDWSDQKKDMVKVYFYQWYEFENFYRSENPAQTLQNPESKLRAMAELQALTQEIPDEDKDLFSFNPTDEVLSFDEKIKKQLEKIFGDFIEIHSYKRKVFYKAIISGSHIFTDFRSPCQQGFTTKFKTGDYDSKNRIWTGMVNSMMEPVMYYNKALTELMFIIGANSKGGVMVEKSAVDDIQKFEGKYAKTDAVIVVNDGALQKGQIKDKKSPQVTTGYEEIIQLSDASISDVNGIDKTFLGSSERKQETGLLQSRRIKQVVSSLACFFDAETLYQKDWARLLLDLMRIYAENNSGGLFRIIGEDGRDQFLKISKDKLVAQYDVMIVEAPQSPEEKQEFATLISAAADKLLQVDPTSAKKLYAIALKYLPLERADQQQIMQILMPTQPQIDPAMVQQLQQQVQALLSDQNQADVKKKLSEFALNLARVGEVHARTGELDSASTKNKAAAFHDVHEALLDEHVAGHTTIRENALAAHTIMQPKTNVQAG
jgi:hypothetical protein